MAGRPFTRTEALAEGIDAVAVRTLVRRGQIRRVVQGVYVDSGVPDSLELRAEALARVLPDDSVICRQPAAWLYGVDVTALSDRNELPRLEFVRPSKSRAVRATKTNGHSQTLLDGDVVEVAGLRVTSPAATAVHLARHLRRPFALSPVVAAADDRCRLPACRAAGRGAGLPRRPGLPTFDPGRPQTCVGVRLRSMAQRSRVDSTRRANGRPGSRRMDGLCCRSDVARFGVRIRRWSTPSAICSRFSRGSRGGGDQKRPMTAYLSMSPTTKNMLPRMAIMSATTQPGSISGRTAMLLKLAERSFIRHGVLSPRDTR
jgi:hypothetical protein